MVAWRVKAVRGPRVATVAFYVCFVTAGSASPGGDDPKGVVLFAPHLRIDWPNRRIELDGKIVLREGMLELFACSPNTREHESVVVVGARPMRINEALALIGATAGNPTRFDDKDNRWMPAQGDLLRIEVRWSEKGEQRTADIGEWMENVAEGDSPPPDVWRFAGSHKGEDGRFAADVDGTVICVVDFGSTLIGLGELKSSNNDELWVRAKESAIPPLDTPITLMITPVKPVVFEIRITAGGETQYDGEPMSMKRLIERIERFERDHKTAAIRISASAGAPKHDVDLTAAAIRNAVRSSTMVDVIPAPATPPTFDPAAAKSDSDPP